MGQSPFYNPFSAVKNLQVFGIVAGEQNDEMQNHLLLPINLKCTAWKVDGANPIYWFIIAPYEKSTFWEWLAICFHYSVSIISISGLSWNNSQRSMIPCCVKQATTFIKSNAFTIQTGPDESSASNFSQLISPKPCWAWPTFNTCEDWYGATPKSDDFGGIHGQNRAWATSMFWTTSFYFCS